MAPLKTLQPTSNSDLRSGMLALMTSNQKVSTGHKPFGISAWRACVSDCLLLGFFFFSRHKIKLKGGDYYTLHKTLRGLPERWGLLYLGIFLFYFGVWYNSTPSGACKIQEILLLQNDNYLKKNFKTIDLCSLSVHSAYVSPIHSFSLLQ
jgi:hypothetical protein